MKCPNCGRELRFNADTVQIKQDTYMIRERGWFNCPSCDYSKYSTHLVRNPHYTKVNKAVQVDMTHTKPIPTKTLNHDIAEETEAINGYDKQGLHKIEAEEREHRKALQAIKKEQSVEGQNYFRTEKARKTYVRERSKLEDRRLILAAIHRNLSSLQQGYVYKGNRWLIGPNPVGGEPAFYAKDLNKGMNSHSYIICKPKDPKHMNFNNIDAWHWYH